MIIDFKMHDEVIIKATGEHAFIVWYDDEEGHDSFLLEIKDKDEMPEFYKRKDFIVIE